MHRLNAPATAAEVRGLPTELASFLRSWNGGVLFVEAYVLRSAAELETRDKMLIFGETETGDLLAIDRSTPKSEPVVRIEADTEEMMIEGSSFARWIEAAVVADGVLHDREGEYAEAVYDETGEELSLEASMKRERKALRIDPTAAGPKWRLSRALEKKGERREAIRLLKEVTADWPEFAWAWFDLGRLLRLDQHLEPAESAFAHAAELPGDNSGYFSAQAARAAKERGDEAARQAHAKHAIARVPGLAAALAEAAKTRLADDVPTEAEEHLSLAEAVAPRDLTVLDLKRTLAKNASAKN